MQGTTLSRGFFGGFFFFEERQGFAVFAEEFAGIIGHHLIFFVRFAN